MIGTFCRNFNHLTKIAEQNKNVKIIIIRNNVYPDIGEVTYNHQTHNIQIYSHLSSNVKDLSCINTDNDKVLFSKYGHIIVCDNSKYFVNWWASAFYNTSIIILPNNFDEMYTNFINNNKKVYNQLVNKYCINDTNATYAFCLSGDSMNFFSWIIKNLYGNKVSWSLIKLAMSWNDKYSFLTNKLSKGTITAYSGFQSFQTMLNEMSNVRQVKRANDSIMQFNTQQKKLLKEKLTDKNIQNVLSKFGQLTDTKRLNFIKKMSTIDDTNEILKHMSHLCEVHFSWNKESFLDYLKNTDSIKYELVLDKNNFVLLKVYDYETIKRLAKTTNWCISKNKRYWNDYVENRAYAQQYILFDFDKKEDDDMSIIGFTVRKNQGITNAHSFTNNNIMGESENQTILNSFLPLSTNCIYSILEKHNIPFDLFFSGNNLRFEWSMDCFFEYLQNIISEDKITILKKEDNKVVFISDSYDIMHLFNNSSLENFDTTYFEYDTMFFLDFNKEINDASKLLFTNIFENDNGEESAGDIFNSNLRRYRVNFDSILDEYGLPYNTIKRIDNPYKRLLNAFSHFDVKSINNILEKHPSVINELKKHKDKSNNIVYSINDSLFTFLSKDLIECFYKHKIKLSDVMSIDTLNDIIFSLIRNVFQNYRFVNHIPTDVEFTQLINKEINDRNQCFYIGYYYLLTEILKNEPYKAFEKTVRNVKHFESNKLLFESIYEPIVSKAISEDINVQQTMLHLSQIAHNFQSQTLIDLLSSVKSETPISDVTEEIKKNLHQSLSFSWSDITLNQPVNPFDGEINF